MKKLIAISIVLFACTTTFAQVSLDEVQKVQQMWGKGKKQLCSELLKLDAGQQEAFGKVYDAYATDRAKIGQERIALIDDYAKNYAGLEDAKAKFLANGFFGNNAKLNKLHKKYFNKFSKVLGSTKAAQWAQLETYLDNVVRSEMQELVPFIQPGQLKKK
jgi:hypothetical protein